MRLTLAVLTLAVAGAAIARIADRPALVAAALGAYALGLLGIVAMLPIYDRRRLAWGGPRVLQLLAGVGWWAAMTVALAVVIARGASDRAVLQAMVVGGFAQILVASLAYLGPVLRGGGARRLTAGFALTRSWLSLVTANVAAVAALTGHRSIMLGALMVWATDLIARAVLLLTKENEHDV
jgi:hypothetical protein